MAGSTKAYMTYEEYLIRLKEGIVTDHGKCPVTPLLLMRRGGGRHRSCMRCACMTSLLW